MAPLLPPLSISFIFSSGGSGGTFEEKAIWKSKGSFCPQNEKSDIHGWLDLPKSTPSTPTAPTPTH